MENKRVNLKFIQVSHVMRGIFRPLPPVQFQITVCPMITFGNLFETYLKAPNYVVYLKDIAYDFVVL